MTIHEAMIAVMTEITAIGKEAHNKSQNFNYRGIDDIYNVMHPLLSKHGIFTTPEVLEDKRIERVSKNGSALAFVSLRVKYTFLCTDGSGVSCTVQGEAMDSGDKATAKAMSIAHKYALLQTFVVPTAELIDQELDTYDEVIPHTKEHEDAINNANTAKELSKAWSTIPRDLKPSLVALKDERKELLLGDNNATEK